MKILSIQKQNLQNTNNRPIAFGGFKNVVVAGDSRDIGRFVAVACRLTEEDLAGARELLKEFRKPKLDADVLSIRADRFGGDLEEDMYNVFVNGHNFFGLQGIDDSSEELTLDLGKFIKHADFKAKLKQLLGKLRGESKLDMAKTKAEEAQMLQALSGEEPLSEKQIITDKSLAQTILEKLYNVIEEDGRVFNVESLNE